MLHQLFPQAAGLALEPGTLLLQGAQLMLVVVGGFFGRVHLVFHFQAILQQRFQLHALAFQGHVGFVELFLDRFDALFGAQHLGVHAGHGVAHGVDLRAQQLFAHTQLVGVVLVVAGLLADLIEAAAQ